jgi:hypothetical protein
MWTPHKRFGHPTFLNLDEQVELVQWVHAQIEPPTIDEFLSQATEIHRNIISKIEPFFLIFGCPANLEKLWEEHLEMSKSWARKVAGKNDLRFMFPEAIEALRLRFGTTALVTRWFGQMESEIVGTNPHLIFNFNEIIVFANVNQKVVTSCNKRVFRAKAKKGPHVTLGLCVSPFRNGPPPLFLLPGAKTPDEFKSFHANTLRVLPAPNGWMTAEIFVQWAEIFVEWLENYRVGLPENIQNQTAILLIDNCRTHCVYSALQIFAAHNSKVISFPPHMTHAMQPIDVACARAFKSALGKSIDHFQKHPEQLTMAKDSDISRFRTGLVMAALSALGNCTVEICMNGYAQCGIWPWSLERVLNSAYVHESDIDHELLEKMRNPNKFHTGSSVMASQDFVKALNEWNHRRNAGN